MQKGWYAFTPDDEFDDTTVGPFDQRSAAQAEADDWSHSHIGRWYAGRWVELYSTAADHHRPPHTQSRIDSFMETVTNTAIGFVISMITWHFVAQHYEIPMPVVMNLSITAIFTIVSIIRQYVLRRAFDGRSPWQAIKQGFRGCTSRVSTLG